MRRSRDGKLVFTDATEERKYKDKKAKFLAEQPSDPRYPVINGSYDISNFNTDRPIAAIRPKIQQPQSPDQQRELQELKAEVAKLSKAVEVLVKCRKNG